MQSIVGQMALTISYSSTVKLLYTVSSIASDLIYSIGRSWVSKTASLHIVYDNINQYRKSWWFSLASEPIVESGMAATLIMQPDTSPNAFDGCGYEEQCSCIKASDVTMARIWDDIDCEHQQSTSVVTILQLLLKHVPAMWKHAIDLEIFAKRLAKHQIPTQKTEVIPLETSGFNEVMTEGNCQTIQDIIGRQLVIGPDAVDGHLIPISGDQMTISQIQTLKRQTSGRSSWWSSNTYILPLIEVWHMKYAMLKGIVKAHWPDRTTKGNLGLQFCAEKLCQKFNANKVEFFPAKQLTKVVLTTLTLHYLRFENKLHTAKVSLKIL